MVEQYLHKVCVESPILSPATMFKSKKLLIISFVIFLSSAIIYIIATKFYIFDACFEIATHRTPKFINGQSPTTPVTEQEVKQFSKLKVKKGDQLSAFGREYYKCKNESHSIFYYLRP